MTQPAIGLPSTIRPQQDPLSCGLDGKAMRPNVDSGAYRGYDAVATDLAWHLAAGTWNPAGNGAAASP